MNIRIKFDIREEIPVLIKVLNKDNTQNIILWDEDDIDIDGDIGIINDAYFKDDVDTSETEYMRDNIKNIFEDYEKGITYKEIEFIDNAGKFVATFNEKEDANKEIHFEYFKERENSSSQIEEDVSQKNNNSSSNNFSYEDDYYVNGKKYISFKKIDKVSTSASKQEIKEVMIDMSKELTRIKAKVIAKDDLER